MSIATFLYLFFIFANFNFGTKTLLSAENLESCFCDNPWDEHFNCIKNCGPVMDLPDSCDNAMSSINKEDGVYLLKFKESKFGLKPFYAYCKRMDNQVWTVIQRREDGSVEFYRNWTDYRQGFGNLYGEFWLGLERLHAMTTQHPHELNIWTEDMDERTAYAHYKEFVIASEAEKYKITFDGYNGTAGNSLHGSGTFNQYGMKFSTLDSCNDNNKVGTCCADYYRGGWWFNECSDSHLNGVYNSSRPMDRAYWGGFYGDLKYVQMAVRRA